MIEAKLQAALYGSDNGMAQASVGFTYVPANAHMYLERYAFRCKASTYNLPLGVIYCYHPLR